MSDKKKEIVVEPPHGAVRPPHPGQEVFSSVLSEDIEWKPSPRFPPTARLPIIVGKPAENGPYTIRVKLSHGTKMMPHGRSEDRFHTVISGVFYIGLGDQFDADKLRAYPPGSALVPPGNTAHFHWAKSSKYVTQVTAIVPLGLDYMTAEDDPRSNTPFHQ